MTYCLLLSILEFLTNIVLCWDITKLLPLEIILCAIHVASLVAWLKVYVEDDYKLLPHEILAQYPYNWVKPLWC